jgi:hypothetical protein
LGKLVEQDANDPPASKLLKEIEAEKSGLLSDNYGNRRIDSSYEDSIESCNRDKVG